MRKSVLAALAAVTTLGAAAPAHAAFPGAPGRIAFVADVVPAAEPGSIPEFTGDELWSANADGSGFLRLTTNDPAVSDTEPAWSPTGRRIAFASDRSGTFQIYTMRQDGTQVRPVTRGSQPARDPAWSPDGLFLVFQRAGDLWITTIAGFPTWRLTHTPGVEESMPAWSPLGLRIAYVVTPAIRDAQIWTIRIDGRDARNLTAVSGGGFEANDTGPNYTPDGRRITFASNRLNPLSGFGPGVWTMRANGTDAKRIVVGLFQEGVAGVAVSPDGSQFVGYTCSSFSCFLPIFTHPTDGSLAVRTGQIVDPTGEGRLLFPDWQPLR